MNRILLKICTSFVDIIVDKLGIAESRKMRFNPTHRDCGVIQAAIWSTLGAANADTNSRGGGANMSTPGTFSELKKVVMEGERIYAEKYKQKYEQSFTDQFAAIDVKSGKAFVALYPEDAIEKARTHHKNAVVHLVRIGAPSAYQVSFMLESEDADLARVL